MGSEMCIRDRENTTVLFICIHKRVMSIVFAVFIKFCDESGRAILSLKLRTFLEKTLQTAIAFVAVVSIFNQNVHICILLIFVII